MWSRSERGSRSWGIVAAATQTFLINVLFSFAILRRVNAQAGQHDVPVIRSVKAMCSSEGITASIEFDRNFGGKIYSLDYANVHECIYYNARDMDTVLFSIPVHRCGTKLSRNTRDVIDQIENRVYVQMDKDTQTAADKQFSFVCQLVGPAEPIHPNAVTSSSSVHFGTPIVPAATPLDGIRRHPVSQNSMRQEIPPDAYAVPRDLPKPPPPMPPPIQPIVQHSTSFTAGVNRITTTTHDINFGNWPLPGAVPYDPLRMPSVPSWPIPLAPIVPQSVHHAPAPPPKVAPPAPPVLSFQGSFGGSAAPTFQGTVGGPGAYATAPVFSTSLNPPNPPTFPMPPSQPVPAYSSSHGFGSPIYSPSPHLQAVQPIQNNMRLQPITNLNLEPVWKGPATKVQVMGDPWFKSVSTKPPPIGFTNDNNRVVESSHSAPSAAVPAKPEIPSSPQAVDTTRMFATQRIAQSAPPQVYLEMQMGEGPRAPVVSRPVKIGENLTLVIRSKSGFKQDKYDMFVHSCFATDGPGTTKVELIDAKGCVVRDQLVGPMHRQREHNGEQFYFFPVRAFKFPGPSDVYFSCIVDVTPLTEAPPICYPKRSIRNRREKENNGTEIDEEEKRELPEGARSLRLFDGVKIELEEQFKAEQASLLMESGAHCFTSLWMGVLATLIAGLAIALFISALFAIRLRLRLDNLQQTKKPAPHLQMPHHSPWRSS